MIPYTSFELREPVQEGFQFQRHCQVGATFTCRAVIFNSHAGHIDDQHQGRMPHSLSAQLQECNGI